MVRKSKLIEKETETVLTLKDVLELGGTHQDFEDLKDIRDGVGTAKDQKKSKELLKEDELKEFINQIGLHNIDVNASERSTVGLSKPAAKQEKSLKKANCDQTRHEQNGSKMDKIANKIIKKPDKPPLQVTLDSEPTRLSIPASKPLSRLFQHVLDCAAIQPTRMLFKPSGIWYLNDVFKLGVRNDESYLESDPIVASLKELGIKLLETEASFFKQQKDQSKGGNDAWMKTVSNAGTLADKIAAYTLMIQQAPIHNFHTINVFLGMLRKKGKREALLALEALQNIFVAELLPDARQLRWFHQQPIHMLKGMLERNRGSATSKRLEIQKYLIQWTFEDYVKKSFKFVVDIIQNVFLLDTLEAMKIKGLKVTLDLLKSKPEQERELLSMLVNKLGDPKYKVASKALHMLHCLVHEHPVMQHVVVSAVRDLILRPNIQAKCQYYCICFMSSQILSNDRKDVAELLVKIYLAFFQAAVSQKCVDNKLLGAILTGINRAYPFTSGDDEKIIEELNILYRTIHVSSFGTSVQAMILLFQVLSSRNELNDRYFNALYSTLLHPELFISSQRHPMYLNLLFRSLKVDPSEARVKAFLKRLLQTCTFQRPPYINAVLVLVTELIRLRPNLRSFVGSAIKTRTVTTALDDDSDEECFVDLNEHGDVTSKAISSENTTEKSWTHIHFKAGTTRSNVYDALHRTPAHACAETSSLWELGLIQRHYHPAVAKFAEQLGACTATGLPDSYSGDPLADFTLMRFLDKFVYRNPKARQEKESKTHSGNSIFRRKRKIYMSQVDRVAANTPEFLKKSTYEPDEVFLQRFFVSRAAELPPAKKRKGNEGSDIEEVSDDEFNDLLKSTEGGSHQDRQYKFAEGMTSSRRVAKFASVPVMEDEVGDENDDVDFDEPTEEFNDDSTAECIGFSVGDGKTEHAPAKKADAKKSSEALDMMLEENAGQKFGSVGSTAVWNADNSSARQLKWEQKRETKNIAARKRERKRQFSGFKRHGPAGRKRFSKKSRSRSF